MNKGSTGWESVEVDVLGALRAAFLGPHRRQAWRAIRRWISRG